MSTTLRPYQHSAFTDVLHLFDNGASRVTLTMPCGTGKTAVAGHILAHFAGFNVVFVPTIALLTQTMHRLAADNPEARFIAVCSPTAVDDDDLPETITASAFNQPVTTDVDELTDLLTGGTAQCVVVATYASADVVAAATDTAGIKWDVVVCDEAHRTTGVAGRAWSLPVDDGLLPARRRLFLTATTRVVNAPDGTVPDSVEDVSVMSMDNLADYGPHVSPLTLRQAIDDGILSNYQVQLVAVTEADIAALLQESEQAGGGLDAVAAASQLALLHAQDSDAHLRSVMAFHNRVADSRQWCRQFRSLATVDGRLSVGVYHVDASTAPTWRTRALRHLAAPGDDVVVVSNCRVFSEGVDVPALDGVLFAAPRTSTVDIVQIVGRALRKHPDGARTASIVLPVVYADGDDAGAMAALSKSSHFAAWQVLTALSEVDEATWRSVVSLQQREVDDADDAPKKAEGTVSVDVSALAEGVSRAFVLRALSPVTAHHPLTAAYLQKYAARTGEANPPRSAVLDGYPLGAKVASARAAWRAGTLSSKVARLYDQVPGFEWEPSRRQSRSVDQWIDLVEQYVQATGVRQIPVHAVAFDAQTGQRAAIGQRLHDYRWRRRLTQPQSARLSALGIPEL